MRTKHVFKDKKRRAKRRRTIWVTVAILCVVAGAALIARAITMLEEVPTDATTTTTTDSTATSSSTLTEGEVTTTTTTTATSATTRYEATTTTTTTTTKKTTTKKTTTASTYADPSGHFVQDRSTTPWNLVLANPWNPLPADYDDNLQAKDGLRGNSSEKIDIRAYDALKQMLADGSKYNLSLASGYRTVEKQRALFEGRVEKWMNKGYSRAEAEKEVLKDTAYPGTSEHNTGLAADLLGEDYGYLTQGFAKTDAYKWLIAHCAEYGFILRYPEGKESITGYTFEPWHYRYVGVETATYIMEHDLTLEEYLENHYQG